MDLILISRCRGIQTTRFFPKTQFFTLENAHFQWFGVQKLGLRTPESKNGHHFSSPTIPKIGELDTCFVLIVISLSGEFWANSKNREFLDHFCRFPIIKPQNQNPMLHSVNFWDKIWFLVCGFFTLLRQLDLSGWVTKMNFSFWGTPYCLGHVTS